MKPFDHTSGTFHRINDCEIYLERKGESDQPIVLFLHGALGNIENFNPIIEALPAHYSILGVDFRGHGKSTLGSDELTYETLQKDIEDILSELGINTLSIIGYSNGGTVAYRLAAFTDLKINKLITICAPWNTDLIEHLLESYSQLTVDMWKEQCPEDFASYKKLNPNTNIEKIFNESIKMALDKHTTGRPNNHVKNIECDSLIIVGKNDPITSLNDANVLQEVMLNTNSKVHELPDSGHDALLDSSSDLTRVIEEFL